MQVFCHCPYRLLPRYEFNCSLYCLQRELYQLWGVFFHNEAHHRVAATLWILYKLDSVMAYTRLFFWVTCNRSSRCVPAHEEDLYLGRVHLCNDDFLRAAMVCVSVLQWQIQLKNNWYNMGLLSHWWSTCTI